MQDQKGKHWEVRLAGRKYEELGRKESAGKKSAGTELFGFVTPFKIGSNSGTEYQFKIQFVPGRMKDSIKQFATFPISFLLEALWFWKYANPNVHLVDLADCFL